MTERFRRIEAAARALLADVRGRHPGEELRCPLMRELAAALGPASASVKGGLAGGPLPASGLIASLQAGGRTEAEAVLPVSVAIERGDIFFNRDMLLQLAESAAQKKEEPDAG